MSIDELGRAAATEARRHAASAVDTVIMFNRLRRQRRRRAAGQILAALGVVAAVVGGGVVISHHKPEQLHNKPVSPPTKTSTGLCANPEVRCLSADKFRFVGLPVPLTVTLPASFHRTFSVGPNSIDAYRLDNTAGVSVDESPRPVRYNNSWTRDPAAGSTAASMARWLSERPFLIHTTLSRTTVGGLPAWHVSGELKPGAALPAAKVGGDIAPTFGISGNTNWGYRANLTGEYTLLDVPGAGVTAIWSWTMNHSDRVLAGNQAFIDGLSFG